MPVINAVELGSADLFGRPSAVGKPSSIMRTGVPMPQVATPVATPSRAQLRRAARTSSGNKALLTVTTADARKRNATALLVASAAGSLGPLAAGAYVRKQVAPATKAGFWGAARVGQARQILIEQTRQEKMAAMGPMATANSGIQPGQARQALIQTAGETKRYIVAASEAARKGDGAGVGRNLKAAGQAYASTFQAGRAILQMAGRAPGAGLKNTDFQSVARVSLPGAAADGRELFESGAWLLDQGSAFSGLNLGVMAPRLAKRRAAGLGWVIDASGANLGDLDAAVRIVGGRVNRGVNRAVRAALPAAAAIDEQAIGNPAVSTFHNGYSGVSGLAQLSALTGIGFANPAAAASYVQSTQAQAETGKTGGGVVSWFNGAVNSLLTVDKNRADVKIAQAQAEAAAAQANAQAAGVRPSALEVLTRPSTLLPILGTVAALGIAYKLFK